jgi:hypothetical protein
MILCVKSENVITVRIERKFKSRRIKFDGSGVTSADVVVIVSEHKVKM